MIKKIIILALLITIIGLSGCKQNDDINDLSEFPKKGYSNFYVILGQDSSPSDVVYTSDLLINLQFNDGIEVDSRNVYFDSDMEENTIPDDKNYIIIGTGCTNKLIDCNSLGLNEGESIIKLDYYKNKRAIFVSGATDLDTQEALDRLANWKDNKLKGTEIFVKRPFEDINK